MPRRTRKQLVGKMKENRQRRESELELRVLAAALRREWRWLSRPAGSRDAA